jgi:REP element-mobilizing transposase RayT
MEHCIDQKGLVVHAWVIMTNHVHLIISKKEPAKKIESILGDLKKFTSLKIIQAIESNPKESRKEWMVRAFRKAGKSNPNNKEYQFWQQDNHPIELVTNEMIEQRLEYIHQNPVEAGFVSHAEDYLYSSAADYAGEKGLLKIELL